jgi:predicted PurR-regulated permease PerM
VVVALAMLVGLLGWLIAPRLAEQAGELREQLPRAVEKVREQLQKTSWGRELIARAPGAGDVSAQGLDVFARATGYITGAFGVLAHGFVVLLLGLFLAIDPGHYRDGAIKLLPFRARPRAREVLDEPGGRSRVGWSARPSRWPSSAWGRPRGCSC